MLPSLVYLFLACMAFSIILVKHGQPRGNYSIWEELFNVFISFGILYWGGFFDPLLKVLFR